MRPTFLLLFLAQTLALDPATYLTTVSYHLEQRLFQPELIQYWGYPVEVYNVTTSDGYIVQMHRIPNGINGSAATNAANRPVIFLQHGLEDDSSVWVMNLPNQSAG